MQTDFPALPLPWPTDSVLRDELAHLGGPPVIGQGFRRTLFPVITKEDVLQMQISILRNHSTSVAQFTEDYRQYVGAPFAIATASGTSSLHLALIGAGVEPGDEVIVPCFTFIATAQAIVAAKAIPVFVDIDPQTYCVDVAAVEAAITPRTRVVMPVHVHGLPANMAALRDLCDRHQLALVEDASHAHSASIDGKVCGSLGDAAGQSLMADKNFPVGGEGGIAFFSDEEKYQRALKFLETSGIDYAMSGIVASFGISQLKRLGYYDAIRQRNADYLTAQLATTGLFSGPTVPAGYVHSYNMYRIKLHPAAAGLDDLPVHAVKAAVQELLLAEGVPAREWQNRPIPGHLPFQNRTGFGNGYPFSLSDRDFSEYQIERFPNTLDMLESTLTLCRELRSPVETERIQSYALAFRKIAARPDVIRELATKGEFPLPYQRDSRLG
ncbi:DegT/DnrJ/EryC1/StrS family aminotransferase [Chromobacterium subtsugae]|uniref:DegT/DnrJ/EryC1/StrS family aminotransferase n=1 Tax=Chromobacterium subtsugae TaxID=251747 RepID=A0ABS7F836_9NEIS|nr:MULTISPECIES: DegT/DnrJ/EryC1/StrS family aminotransferase [Chromobacterium]KUM04294.1 pyridoxal phosphate-dependent enzyme [Chromobacterium subtsugae]KZE83304.1 pyridoxal phosphate-dependent enzyme [Chromobacterium sp. F49]MBW7565221.1 DegT/DnrJ/EryC1/StrS family aminotransferase [Chromobacterium subtsugae]MBW8286251.1 DegT/DnrJ/EryC1/StrS family aminotransferase [Chromobacterium subtsugae]OBU87854.1 pyridoxal phosphate-dependent enzyme [Chromobacterium subtsugae]